MKGKTMKRPTPAQIRDEAIEYLHRYDADFEPCPYHDRSAAAIADFLLESKFAQIDEECDWPEDFCREYFEAAEAALLGAGVPT